MTSFLRRCVLVLFAAVFFTTSLSAAIVWRLEDARFDDGGTVNGYFTWDPATRGISDWRFEVAGGGSNFPSRTYTPQNSSAMNDISGRGIIVRSTTGDNRTIQLRAESPRLPTTPEVVPILTSDNASFECFDCTPSRSIVAGLLDGTSQFDVYLPISGSVRAVNGQFFRSNVRIMNRSFGEMDADITFLPPGADNAAATATSMTIPARQMIDLNDIVGTTLGKSGLGAVRIRSTNGSFDVTQNIFTDSVCAQPAGGGVFGQFGTGVSFADASYRGVLLMLRSDSAARTNVGFVNPNNFPVTVELDVYASGEDGIKGEGTVTLPPYGMITPSSLLQLTTMPQLASAWVRVSASAPIIGYASVVDNGSGDQYYVPMMRDQDF